jgi:hypothetical protein
MNKSINVVFADEHFKLSSALISGKIDDNYGTPTSCYAGSLNPEEVHSALFYAHRAVIRILIDEFNVPLENVDDFLLSALSEALTKEYNNHARGETDMDIKKSIKFNKSQY